MPRTAHDVATAAIDAAARRELRAMLTSPEALRDIERQTGIDRDHAGELLTAALSDPAYSAHEAAARIQLISGDSITERRVRQLGQNLGLGQVPAGRKYGLEYTDADIEAMIAWRAANGRGPQPAG